MSTQNQINRGGDFLLVQAKRYAAQQLRGISVNSFRGQHNYSYIQRMKQTTHPRVLELCIYHVHRGSRGGICAQLEITELWSEEEFI